VFARYLTAGNDANWSVCEGGGKRFMAQNNLELKLAGKAGTEGMGFGIGVMENRGMRKSVLVAAVTLPLGAAQLWAQQPPSRNAEVPPVSRQSPQLQRQGCGTTNDQRGHPLTDRNDQPLLGCPPNDQAKRAPVRSSP
jgi:hypothetical protein